MGTSTDLLIAEAVKRLDKIGFLLPPDSDFDFHLAASKFNSGTLHIVIGLGRILEIEQPLTVRGPFYRAVSAGLFLAEIVNGISR